MRRQRTKLRTNDVRRPRGFVLSAAFLALILVTGIVLTVLRLTESNDNSTTAHDQVNVSTQPNTDYHCLGSTVDSSETPPEVSPATWSLVGSMHAPAITGVGPTSLTTSGIPQCFAGTPSGVVLAAANYVAYGTGRPDLAKELALSTVAPGAGRALAIEAAETATTMTSQTLRIVGYRLDGYSPELAKVTLAVQTVDGSLVSGELALTWTDGDWKLIADPATGAVTDLNSLSSLGGFIPWGAS